MRHQGTHHEKKRCVIGFLGIFFSISCFLVGISFAVDMGDPAHYQVFLYEHANYGGATLSFAFDTDVPDLTKWHLPNSSKKWNDVISSIKVGKNTKIILYEHINYKGAKIILQGNGQKNKNYPNLHSFGWGDKISSFKVRRSDYAQ
jgi:hypothetical protein